MLTDYLRIEKAINYIKDNYRDQPSLDELSEHLNLSPFHFQRLFRRWAGISPKRFLQFLTIEHAKRLLNESRSILDTTYESGLSGPGRLHDLFVAIDAVTPGEFKTQGFGLEISYGFHPSPFGECLLATTERGICGLSFVEADTRDEALAILRSRWKKAEVKESPQTTESLMDRIFPAGPENRKRSVSLLLKGTNFQIKVWEALLRIPPGFVCSYEDVAKHIGKPAGVQAVGNAVAANPVAYIVPCHRVIRKIGVFGNYRWGITRKKALIGWELAHRYGGELSQETSGALPLRAE